MAEIATMSSLVCKSSIRACAHSNLIRIKSSKNAYPFRLECTVPALGIRGGTDERKHPPTIAWSHGSGKKHEFAPLVTINKVEPITDFNRSKLRRTRWARSGTPPIGLDLPPGLHSVP